MSEGPKNGVWVGLRDCGCAVAVVCDDGDPKKKRMVNSAKREYLKQGLSVVHATWQEWQEKYRPNFTRNCEHTKAGGR